ncbi:prohibitin-1 [Apiotrichum porosum]|uniref:Prohibitin n=1 Tax=Apiotrichum porosum TaxID=105984 RepID=A0A427XPY2_9TREE|nr:prohibitin-1 [Apiotrichum porosum]RSH80899.1 prohibitin-1 [Apiotrichum porosum]
MAFAQNLSRLIVPVAIAGALIDASMYDVPGGYRAVMFDRFSGVQPNASGEGTHFLVPWLQKAILYDVRIKPRVRTPPFAALWPPCLPLWPQRVHVAQCTDYGRTSRPPPARRMVSLTLRVMSRPDVNHLSEIYQNLGLDYDERVLPSIGNEVLKATVAQFDASELITNREIVSARIRDDLLNRAKEFNLVLEDVSITHMTFGKEFTTAVEQKQIAQQDAERAKFVVEKAEQERQAAVIRAEGEAEAASTISAALAKAGDAFVQFRKIETAREIAGSLSQSRNVSYVPASGGNLLLQVPPAKSV